MEELQEPYEVEVYHRQPNALAPPELAKVHPLGKAPVISITAPGATAPVVLAETPFIFEYLLEHSEKGKSLVPTRWKEGQEGKMLGETEAWMRYQYLMYYIEGSFMPVLVQYLVISGKNCPALPCPVPSLGSHGAGKRNASLLTIDSSLAMKGNQVPLLIRPISSAIASRLISMVTMPNMKRHLGFLEGQLETSGGDFITGPDFTAADIQLGYGLIAGKLSFDKMGKWDKGTARETYPKLFAYIDRLEQHPGYLKAVEKSKEVDNGEFAIAPKL